MYGDKAWRKLNNWGLFGWDDSMIAIMWLCADFPKSMLHCGWAPPPPGVLYAQHIWLFMSAQKGPLFELCCSTYTYATQIKNS